MKLPPKGRYKAALEDEPLSSPAYQNDGYLSLLMKAAKPPRNRLAIGVPVTGQVRVEWMQARYGQVIPTNWSYSDVVQMMNQMMPLGYAVAEARNIIVDIVVKQGFEWLLFIDSDVVLPHDAFVKLNEYMRDGRYPIVSGLYFCKAHPAEPLVYRGRGNNVATGWKLGELVWADGCGMGCLLMHVSILRPMHEEAPEYLAGGNIRVKKVFDTPYGQFFDPETLTNKGFVGTEDLPFWQRMMAGNYLAKAGWKAIARRKYPILVDTSIFCGHITPEGVMYPLSLDPSYQPV